MEQSVRDRGSDGARDGHASSVDALQDEGHFLHLCGECRHVHLDAVVGGEAGEELVVDREGRVLCGYAL